MSQTTAAAAASDQRPDQNAIKPLSAVDKEDLGTGARIVDEWLRTISGDLVTLDRLHTLASALPVVGNVLALVDVMSNLVKIYQKGKDAGFDEWFNLGTDLIGVIPGVGSAARVALRPALHAVKKDMPRIIANAAKQQLSDALIELLMKHLADTHVGTLETFAAEAEAKVDAFINQCADLVEKLIDSLIETLQQVVDDPNATPPKPLAASGPAYSDEEKPLGSLFGHIVRVYRETAVGTAVFLARNLMRDEVKAELRKGIAGLRSVRGEIRPKLQQIVNAKQGIKPILTALKVAAGLRLKKLAAHPTQQAAVIGGKDAKANEKVHGAKAEAASIEAPATGEGGCKSCPLKSAPKALPKGSRSISYVTGAETFTHTDFVLEAPLPIEWSRTYRSNLSAYDQGSLGARWLTPYSSRVDVTGDDKGLRYHGADGRSHNYPWLKVGQQYFDRIEEVRLWRHSETLLILDFGKPLPEDMASPGARCTNWSTPARPSRPRRGSGTSV